MAYEIKKCHRCGKHYRVGPDEEWENEEYCSIRCAVKPNPIEESKMSYNQAKCEQCGAFYRVPEGTLSKVCGKCAIQVDPLQVPKMRSPKVKIEDRLRLAEEELSDKRSRIVELKQECEALRTERDTLVTDLMEAQTTIADLSGKGVNRDREIQNLMAEIADTTTSEPQAIKHPFAYELAIGSSVIRIEAPTIPELVELKKKAEL